MYVVPLSTLEILIYMSHQEQKPDFWAAEAKSSKRSEKIFQPQKIFFFFQTIIGNNSHIGLTLNFVFTRFFV